MRHMLQIASLCCCLALLSGCATGRTAFSRGEKLERDGNLDEAVLRYAEAVKTDPSSGEYKARFLRVKEEAARVHYKAGEGFLAEKEYDQALREYQTALALDPALSRAKQQSDLVVKLRDSIFFYKEGEEFEKGRKPREAWRSYLKALELNPANREAQDALDRLLKTRKPKLDGYELNLKSVKPITLKFKDAKVKDVFTILSQLSGINFIFDEGLKDQNISIYLENASFLQALEILTGLNKLGKKVLNESTIIIYPKTPDKSKQYEELMVQTFYLTNTDAKKAVNLLRTMLQLRKVYVNEEHNAIVIRDTPEMLEVAQKILEANDLPDAEVLLELEVIELSKKNVENFGLALSSYSLSAGFAKGNNPPSLLSNVLTGTAPSFVDTTKLLEFRFGTPHGFFTVPSATYNFSKTLANGETLSNPKIRVKNREKAKFTVGDRIPITTTTTANVTTSVNVQYVDVGVKVSAEPTIQPNNEVSLKLSLEVSSAGAPRTVSGSEVVDISNRNLDTVLSVKDGETTIIGGLISNRKDRSKNKIFLLGDIPFLGPLLSSSSNTDDKKELVLAITPRIIRSVPAPEPEVASFWSGREDDPMLKKPYAAFVQEPEFPGILPPAPKPEPVPTTAAPAKPAAAPGAPAPAPAPARGTLTITAPGAAKVGEEFAVEVKVADVTNLYAAPFTLVFDPIFLDFVGVSEGSFLKQDGKPTSFTTSVDANAGTVEIKLDRVGDVGGINGSGTVVTAVFKAKNAGPASVGLQNVNFMAPGGKSLEIVPYNAAVEIK